MTNPRILVPSVVLFAFLIGLTINIVVKQNNLNRAKTAELQADKLSQNPQELDESEPSDEQTTAPDPIPTTAETNKPSSKPSPAAPTTAAQPNPSTTTINTTNCLPESPSTYQTAQTGKTNSAYLLSNSYSTTAKMHAALQFAGLLSAVDAKQVVVFTPNDWVFDNKLTSTQMAWMNQSPTNMRSVIGWHVATSCITYDGLNPIKGKAGAVSVNTLNGPVTYMPGGTGKIDNAPIAVWDWFTSNGSVTFVTDFIKPPIVP